MRKVKLKKEQYLRRRRRSKKPFPVKDEYRLCIFKSAKHIEAQIIDDFNQTTLVAASSKEKAFSKEKVNKSELASLVGKSLSERAKAKKVKKVYFDRNGFRYHGRVKSFAEASREGGLKF
ncbi:MAG: 50S ribosomal protein L18 [Candidatus Marinimicrobia bacterium]|nr:50S ribosomal protein L18 [Candidatus Neomarinimicrobiota bacterium]